MPTKVRIYNNLVKAEVLKQGFVGVIMESPADLDYCNVMKDVLEQYDICVDLRVISSERVSELAATYNTSIEPVAVIAVGSDGLIDALADNLGVPVITAEDIDNTAYTAVCSLNVPAIRERIAADIDEMKQSLIEADTSIRN